MKSWGYALERTAPVMLQLALQDLRRQGGWLRELPGCNGDPCSWVKGVAECLHRRQCDGAVIFCSHASPACCLANKVKGIRAAKIDSIVECETALRDLGANAVIVDPAGRTYYEFKEILRLCSTLDAPCPPGVACVIEELEQALSPS